MLLLEKGFHVKQLSSLVSGNFLKSRRGKGNKNKAELQWEVHLKRIENPDLEACGGKKHPH